MQGRSLCKRHLQGAGAKCVWPGSLPWALWLARVLLCCQVPLLEANVLLTSPEQERDNCSAKKKNTSWISSVFLTYLISSPE